MRNTSVIPLLIALILLAMLVFVPVCARAHTCQWTWEPVSSYDDGTPVADLAGYRLYLQGTAGPHITIPAPATTATTPCQVGEVWTVTAYRVEGQESPPSVAVTVPDVFAPLTPQGFRLDTATLSVTIRSE